MLWQNKCKVRLFDLHIGAGESSLSDFRFKLVLKIRVFTHIEFA